jgi:hypothetical protein
MIANELRRLLEREPFVPFQVVMSRDKTYRINNPGLVVVMKSEFFVAFPDGENWAHVPYLHVAGIESAGRNGGRKTPRRKRRP